jgi:hydrogenase expression/formation protein HypC
MGRREGQAATVVDGGSVRGDGSFANDVYTYSCTLDHDGCVVCSDMGIPLRVKVLMGDDALCEDAVGNQATIAVELVAPVQVGDVLLTHGGVAIGREADQAWKPELPDPVDWRSGVDTAANTSGEGQREVRQ